MNNNQLNIYNNKFYHRKKKQFIQAGWINYSKKQVGEFNTSNVYMYAGNGAVDWVRPTFCFDSEGHMIYEHDLVTDGTHQYEVVWSDIDNCFALHRDSDEPEELFIDDSKLYKVVGTTYNVA